MKKKLIALAVSTLFILTGCATGTELGEASLGSQSNEENQSEQETQESPQPEPRKTSRLDPEVLARAQAAEKARLEAEGNLDLRYARENNLWKISTFAGEVAEEARKSVLALKEPMEENDSLLASAQLSEEDKKLFQAALLDSQALWSDLIGKNEGFRLVVFTETEGAWADDVAADLGASKNQMSWVKRIKSEGCNGGNASPVASVAFVCAGTYFTDNERSIRRLVSHEYFHEVQRQMEITHLDWPLWLMEGSATYAGELLAVSTGEEILTALGSTKGEVLAKTFGSPQVAAISADISETQALELYTALDVPPTNETRQVLQDLDGYDFGALAFGRLIEEHGISKVIEFIERSADEGISELFTELFAHSKTDFFLSMSGYLQSRFVWDY